MTNALQAGSQGCPFPPGRRKGRVEKIKWRMLGLLFMLGCLPFVGFAQLPTISGISPALGTTIPGTVVTITGSNFNTSIANNIVQFGAVKGTVTAATATSLTVTTPVGATYAPVTVLNTSSGLTGTSVKPFMPTFVGKGSLTNNDFLPPVGYLTGSSAFAPAIGDLDNDGKPDLVTVNNAGNSVSVFRNISSSGSITASSFAGKVDYASGGDSPDFIAIGDLDGDNRLDIIITNRNSSSVSVFRNNSSAPGSISFQSQVSFATGLNPNCVAIGDLDKDGRQDLVVSNNGASTISVLRNLSSSGSINFAAQFTVATNSSPMSVAIGDLDGDGKSDVAISNSSIGTLSVYNNTSTPGTISFGSGASVAAASTFGRLAIGDLDGDGKSDLVVSGSSGGDFLSVLQNSSFPGTLRFEPKIGFSTGVGGTNPYSVAIGDLDGDNKPDLAVSNIFGSSVTVLRNTTSIVGLISTTSFAFRQVVSIGTFPVGLAIGDLDGDGRPDMALTGGSAGLQVLRNNPSTIVSFNANGGSGSMTDQIIALDVPASLTSNAFTRSGYSFGGWNTSADGSGIVYNNATIYAASTATATLYAQWVQAPTITAFFPAIGNPGTLVTLSGTNLALPTAVNIGGVPAIVVSKTNTSLVAMVMPGATSGSILVSNGAGTGSASGSFTVTATPYPVAQQGGKLVGTGSTGVSSQGQSVAVSADGNTAIVGGLSDNNGAGAARVYTRSGGIWTQQGPKLVGTGAVGNANQGRSVSLSADGNTAIVGGIADNGYVGAAWVFTRSGGIWTQQGPKLVGTGAVGTSFQGSDLSLSADGNTAIVGGYQDNNTAGAAWVFARSGGTWTQQGGKLVGFGNNSTQTETMGSSVALSADGNTAIVGAPRNDNSGGIAYLFKRNGSTWAPQQRLYSLSSGFNSFGSSVSLSADGTTALVGSNGDNSNVGAAWVFPRIGGAWNPNDGKKLLGTGTIGSANLGLSVSLSADGKTAVVGGSGDNNGVGAAWVYTFNGAIWRQQGNKLVGTGGIGNTRQGKILLSADGNTVISGGLDDNNGLGAAWVFAAIPDPGVIGNAHTVVKPQERNPDYVTNVRSASDIWVSAYTWQDSTASHDWQSTTPAQIGAEFSIPELSVTTKYRRGVSGAFGTVVWSNPVQIKVLGRNAAVQGKVVSVGGSPIKDVVIRIRKTVELPGSSKEYEYTGITNFSGNFLIPVYYGDDNETGTEIPVSTTFTVLADKPGIQNPNPQSAELGYYKTESNLLTFIDASGYVINGRIYQQCAGCLDGSDVEVDNIKSYLNEVEIYSDNAFQMKSAFINNNEGSWAVNVTEPGTFNIKPLMEGRTFSPATQPVPVISSDVSGVEFRDVTTRTISGRIGDGCFKKMGIATLLFKDVRRDKDGKRTGSVFLKKVTTNSDGFYTITLPARLYKVEVLSFTSSFQANDISYVSNDEFKTFFNLNLDSGSSKKGMPYDSLLVDISKTNQTHNLWFRRSPKMALNLANATCTPSGSTNPQDLGVILFPQSKRKPYQVNVYQGDPALNCPVKDDTVIVNTNIQRFDENEKRVILTKNGIAYDTLTGGIPIIIDPYRKNFSLSFSDQFERDAPALDPSRKFVVTGVKADDESSFATVSPEVPIMILHDPAGDGSYSYWQTDQTLEQATSWSVSDGTSKGAWAEVKLGAKFETGIGVTVESAVWGKVNGSVDVNATTIDSKEFIVSTTTSQVISTSSDEDITGNRGDLFIGAAMNLIYARSFEVKLDGTCALDITKNLMIANDGFATQYVYTDGAIRDNVIPTLREFSINPISTASQKKSYLNQLKVWEQVLANNEANKRRAALDKNISFFGSSGAIENSTTTTSTSTSTLEFDMEIDAGVAAELGFEYGGSGGGIGGSLRFRTETGQSKSTTQTKSTTIGYVLDDNDALDNFSINVKKDPVYNTPVFETVAGQSSCPKEDFTKARDEPTLSVQGNPEVVAPATSDAVFGLVLGNTSVDVSPRTYNLSFDQASNPSGATISIGGIAMGAFPIPYSIGQLDQVPVTVNVKRNQANSTFTYEGLKFNLSDACSGDIVKTASLTARFQAACDPVTFVAPEESWLINEASGSFLPITFKNYTIGSVQSVAVEYLPVNSSNWRTGETWTTLDNPQFGTTRNWNVSGLADGVYYLRLKMSCSGGLVYTQRVKGTIDRKGPVVFGTPQPSDYNYSVGDEISFSYNENINTQNLNQSIASLERLSTGGFIPVSVTGFANKLVVVSQNDLTSYSGEDLRLVVKDVEDIYGNIKAKYDTLVFSVGTFAADTSNKALQIAAPTSPKIEGSASPIEFTFTLPKKLTNPIQINFLAGGTALYGADYSVGYSSTSPLNSFDGSRGTIIFPKNQLSVTLKVYPKLDAIQELDETILINLAEGGDYKIGSDYKAMTTILDNSLAAPTITGPAQFCPGGSAVLTANHPLAGTSGYSFLWSTGATTPTITVSQAGSYTVKIKQNTGAEGTSSAFVLGLYTLPTVSAGADLSITQGSGNFPLGGSPTGGVWSGTGVTASTFNTNLALGAYELKYCVNTAEGCTKCDTLVITLKAGNPGLAATPQFSVAAGTYSAAQTVAITTNTPGASIYYTTTGNTPLIGAGYTKLYTGPVSVTQTTTIKAMAVLTGLTNSAVATAAYTITTPSVVATPVISVPTGSYASAQFVTLTTATAGASIYYTTSGNTPVVGTSYTKLYSATPFQVTASATVRAIAVKTGMTTSATAVSYITIAAPQISLTNTPVISPATGTYGSPQTVTITCSTPGAQIWYTTSGNVPRLDVANGFTKLYTAPFVVSKSTTIRAVAVKTNWLQSGTSVSYCTIAAARQAVAADEQEEEVPVNESSVSIYPNPSANGMFHVEISGSDSETRFDVTGVDGRIIQQGEWNTNAGQVDLSSYPTGMYLLKIVQQDRIVTRRLIKM